MKSDHYQLSSSLLDNLFTLSRRSPFLHRTHKNEVPQFFII
ncbi:MAG: hypothetical protein ACP5RH_00795 [Leptodesmis sp.]